MNEWIDPRSFIDEEGPQPGFVIDTSPTVSKHTTRKTRRKPVPRDYSHLGGAWVDSLDLLDGDDQ